MSNTTECVKGGISIIWSIENFFSLPDNWRTSFPVKWPYMEGKWRVDITVFNIFNKHKDIAITINKLDKKEPCLLVGNMFFVNGAYHFEVKRHERFDYHDMTSCNIPIKRIDWEKEGLINNGSLTFRINLWDPTINDLLLAEYIIRSTAARQACSFQWTLKSVSDWENKKKIVKRRKKSKKEVWKEYKEISIDVPMEIKNFLNFQDYNLTMSLQSFDDGMIISFLMKDTEKKDFRASCTFNLKFQHKESTTPTSLDTGWKKTTLYHFPAATYKFLPLMSEAIQNYLQKESIVKTDIIIESDCLCVKKKVRYENGIQNLNWVSRLPEKLPKCNLQKSIHSLFKEGKFCDIMLHVCKETFNCHKAVLCARSPIFKEILENEITKGEQSVINIAEGDSLIFSMFLNYLYTDTLEDAAFDSVVKLYATAEKYAVEHLQKKCANLIVSSLSPDNVCEALQLANSHQDQYLKKEILCYFSSHVKEIENSSSWKKLLDDNPLLAAETLQAAVK